MSEQHRKPWSKMQHRALRIQENESKVAILVGIKLCQFAVFPVSPSARQDRVHCQNVDNGNGESQNGEHYEQW